MPAIVQQLSNPTPGQLDQLTQLWEDSVRATHHFLTERDILSLKPQVREAVASIEALYIIRGASGAPVAFMGVEEHKLEMLFVSPEARGAGLGRTLIRYAMERLEIRYVDVNEQNPGALGFYEHMGFRTFRRSETDGQGNPFPILHMKLCSPME